MSTQESVYEKTYHYYLQQIREVSFETIAPGLGATLDKDKLMIPLFSDRYGVSADGFTDGSGQRPAHDICVILSKYILLCPKTIPKERDWVAFRDFKDSSPLISYFTHSVEGAIGSCFQKRLDALKEAGGKLGGYAPALMLSYDLVIQLDALPKISILLLFNDTDEEFPATCSVLFEARAEEYLDAECIAMVGWQLFDRLKQAAN